MDAGSHLRQIRERLGLTYREVQRASFSLAKMRSCPEFVLHISRLAEIENRSVVPSLHKLYALSVVYHLHPLEIFQWYDIPLHQFFGDAASLPAPQTHLMASPGFLHDRVSLKPTLLPDRTEFLSPTATEACDFRNILTAANCHHRYGCIGLRDRRMSPILRPGSVVLVDASVRRIQESEWSTEYDRPMYFVELHDGYRCGWFQQDGARLVMQPHPLSRCMPESWKMPDEAEVVGRVVGIVTRQPVPLKALSQESPEWRVHSSKKAP